MVAVSLKKKMPTTPQLIQKARTKRANQQKAPALNRCPQRRGVCVRVYTTTPKNQIRL